MEEQPRRTGRRMRSRSSRIFFFFPVCGCVGAERDEMWFKNELQMNRCPSLRGARKHWLQEMLVTPTASHPPPFTGNPQLGKADPPGYYCASAVCCVWGFRAERPNGGRLCSNLYDTQAWEKGCVPTSLTGLKASEAFQGMKQHRQQNEGKWNRAMNTDYSSHISEMVTPLSHTYVHRVTIWWLLITHKARNC